MQQDAATSWRRKLSVLNVAIPESSPSLNFTNHGCPSFKNGFFEFESFSKMFFHYLSSFYSSIIAFIFCLFLHDFSISILFSLTLTSCEVIPVFGEAAADAAVEASSKDTSAGVKQKVVKRSRRTIIFSYDGRSLDEAPFLQGFREVNSVYAFRHGYEYRFLLQSRYEEAMAPTWIKVFLGYDLLVSEFGGCGHQAEAELEHIIGEDMYYSQVKKREAIILDKSLAPGSEEVNNNADLCDNDFQLMFLDSDAVWHAHDVELEALFPIEMEPNGWGLVAAPSDSHGISIVVPHTNAWIIRGSKGREILRKWRKQYLYVRHMWKPLWDEPRTCSGELKWECTNYVRNATGETVLTSPCVYPYLGYDPLSLMSLIAESVVDVDTSEEKQSDSELLQFSGFEMLPWSRLNSNYPWTMGIRPLDNVKKKVFGSTEKLSEQNKLSGQNSTATSGSSTVSDAGADPESITEDQLNLTASGFLTVMANTREYTAPGNRFLTIEFDNVHMTLEQNEFYAYFQWLRRMIADQYSLLYKVMEFRWVNNALTEPSLDDKINRKLQAGAVIEGESNTASYTFHSSGGGSGSDEGSGHDHANRAEEDKIVVEQRVRYQGNAPSTTAGSTTTEQSVNPKSYFRDMFTRLFQAIEDYPQFRYWEKESWKEKALQNRMYVSTTFRDTGSGEHFDMHIGYNDPVLEDVATNHPSTLGSGIAKDIISTSTPGFTSEALSSEAKVSAALSEMRNGRLKLDDRTKKAAVIWILTKQFPRLRKYFEEDQPLLTGKTEYGEQVEEDDVVGFLTDDAKGEAGARNDGAYGVDPEKQLNNNKKAIKSDSDIHSHADYKEHASMKIDERGEMGNMYVNSNTRQSVLHDLNKQIRSNSRLREQGIDDAAEGDSGDASGGASGEGGDHESQSGSDGGFSGGGSNGSSKHGSSKNRKKDLYRIHPVSWTLCSHFHWKSRKRESDDCFVVKERPLTYLYFAYDYMCRFWPKIDFHTQPFWLRRVTKIRDRKEAIQEALLSAQPQRGQESHSGTVGTEQSDEIQKDSESSIFPNSTHIQWAQELQIEPFYEFVAHQLPTLEGWSYRKVLTELRDVTVESHLYPRWPSYRKLFAQIKKVYPSTGPPFGRNLRNRNPGFNPKTGIYESNPDGTARNWDLPPAEALPENERKELLSLDVILLRYPKQVEGEGEMATEYLDRYLEQERIRDAPVIREDGSGSIMR